MKKAFVINPHSFLDVVTNSSSELFLCDTEKGLEFVEDILKDLLHLYDKANDTHHLFEDVFKVRYCSQHEYEDMKTYWEEHYSYEINRIKDKNINDVIVIESTDDNSIPYALFDFIEETFNAGRLHLG